MTTVRSTETCIICGKEPSPDQLFIEVSQFGTIWSDRYVAANAVGWAHLACVARVAP